MSIVPAPNQPPEDLSTILLTPDAALLDLASAAVYLLVGFALIAVLVMGVVR